jgi:hypothetical protein
MLRTIIIGLFMMFVVTGCFHNNPKPIQYPKWYNNTIQDTATTYYGTAEGSSKKEAITNALNEIASKVSISIESTFQSNTISSNTQYQKIISKNVKNEVKKIEFTQYNIVKFKKISNNKFIVRVSIDKEANAKITQKRIETKLKEYKQLLAQKNNLATKLKQYNKILKEIINNLIPKCFIVKTLYNTQTIDMKLDELLSLQEAIQKFIANISFKIDSNKSGYDKVIAQILSEKNYTVVTTNPNIYIKIDAKEQKISAVGYKILKTKITITIYENKKIIGTKVLTVGAKSLTNYNQAKEFALKDFKNKLKSNNTLNLLLGI